VTASGRKPPATARVVSRAGSLSKDVTGTFEAVFQHRATHCDFGLPGAVYETCAAGPFGNFAFGRLTASE